MLPMSTTITNIQGFRARNKIRNIINEEVTKAFMPRLKRNGPRSL